MKNLRLSQSPLDAERGVKHPCARQSLAVRIPPNYEGVGRRETLRKVKYRGMQIEARIFKIGIEESVKSRESDLTEQRLNRIVRGCWVRGD
jgi:hypothetical protein